MELSRIWSSPDRTLVEREYDQSVFDATKTKRRLFEELYYDAQHHLDSQLPAAASRGPKCKFAPEVTQESLAIKTVVYGQSTVTSAAIADYEKQIAIHEE